MLGLFTQKNENLDLTDFNNGPNGWAMSGFTIKTGTSGTDFWAIAYINGIGNMKKSYNTDKPLILFFDRKLLEHASIKVKIDGGLAKIIKGPRAWERIDSPIIIPQLNKHVEVTIEGVGDVSIDDIQVQEYDPVRCIFQEYNPPRPDIEMARNDILRGFSGFSATRRFNTVMNTNLMFIENSDYLNFVSKTNGTYIFRDENGIYYRGVITEIGDVTKYGVNSHYEVPITFESPQQCGVMYDV